MIIHQDDADTEETTAVECPFAQHHVAHQIRIARATLRMPDITANILGSMSKDQARAVLLHTKGNP